MTTDQINEHPERFIQPKKRIVVGLAQVNNVYGGPEEGGWYYDAGEPVDGYTKVFFRSEEAFEYRNYLETLIGKFEAFRGVGVGGCGDDDGLCRGEVMGDGLQTVVQWHPKKSNTGLQSWPEYTPRYE